MAVLFAEPKKLSPLGEMTSTERLQSICNALDMVLEAQKAIGPTDGTIQLEDGRRMSRSSFIYRWTLHGLRLARFQLWHTNRARAADIELEVLHEALDRSREKVERPALHARPAVPITRRQGGRNDPETC